tara:strand:+ start:3269 stop:3613 length:345 start_codon:yes stop_codon:yes gene_type:complete
LQDEVTSHDRHHTTRLVTEGSTLYVDTQFHNKASLEINKKIRNSQMLDKLKLGLHDNEDVRATLSIPSNMEWELFKKKHPDIYNDLKAPQETDRMSALRRIQLLEPEWVLMERF